MYENAYTQILNVMSLEKEMIVATLIMTLLFFIAIVKHERTRFEKKRAHLSRKLVYGYNIERAYSSNSNSELPMKAIRAAAYLSCGLKLEVSENEARLYSKSHLKTAT